MEIIDNPARDRAESSTPAAVAPDAVRHVVVTHVVEPAADEQLRAEQIQNEQIREARDRAARRAEESAREDALPPTRRRRSGLVRWLMHDWPYIAMLALAVVGVTFRLQVTYWLILMPLFAVISMAAGFAHYKTARGRLDMVFRLALSWGALLVAIYLLYNNGVQGILTANSSSLTMMTLLALGTFIAGVESRVWRICAVGAVLFLGIPAFGWLDQSLLFLMMAAVAIVAIGGLVWWGGQRWSREPAIE